MNNPKTNKVTRLEVIDHTAPIAEGGGRSVLFWDEGKQVDVELQDNGRTMKVFIHERYEDSPDESGTDQDDSQHSERDS